MNAPVVAGTDGSESSLRAVELAAHEARLRGRALRVVHAFTWPMTRVPLGASPLGPPDGGLRDEAETNVAEALARARAAEPRIDVDGDLVTGEPLAVLAAESRTADLVVVGSRGLGGFTGLLIGSVAVHLAAHGECPVLVVRGREEAQGPVLLAVDGAPDGTAALEFGFAEAQRRGLPLQALHSWNDYYYPTALAPGTMMPVAFDQEVHDSLETEAHRLLTEALAGPRERYPDVHVDAQLDRLQTRPALIEASRRAGLLVVGARGRGGFAGLLLGSVSQAMVHHADCPVAVVRPGAEEPQD